MDELLKYLRAMVALQVASMNKGSDSEPVKVELLLSRAGIAVKEIAEMLGKSPAAVAKTIQRAKQAGTKAAGDVAPASQTESAA